MTTGGVAVDDYEELKNKAKLRYEARIAAAKEEYRTTLAGIDQVRRLLGGSGSRKRTKGLADAVSTAICDMKGSITSERVVRTLTDSGVEAHRASVASVLRRLAADGTDGLDVVIEPRGRRAGVYKRRPTIGRII